MSKLEKTQKPIEPVLEFTVQDHMGNEMGKLDFTVKQLNALREFAPEGEMSTQDFYRILEENKG